MADSEPSAASGPRPHEHESLLLLARPSDAGAAAYCRDHLGHESAPIVLLVDRQTDDEDRRWDPDGRPGVVVAIGDSKESATTTPMDPVPPSSPPETVVVTEGLGSVGRTVDDHVRTWAASGHRPVVCVDSLSGLIAHSHVRAVYRLLYVLCRRIQGTDGAVHAHADPRVYEEEILRTFFSLFDRVVSFQAGGSQPR